LRERDVKPKPIQDMQRSHADPTLQLALDLSPTVEPPHVANSAPAYLFYLSSRTARADVAEITPNDHATYGRRAPRNSNDVTTSLPAD